MVRASDTGAPEGLRNHFDVSVRVEDCVVQHLARRVNVVLDLIFLNPDLRFRKEIGAVVNLGGFVAGALWSVRRD